MTRGAYPLDLQATGYAYLERPNSVLLGLLGRHVMQRNPNARVLDVGCGVGANAQALKTAWPDVSITGVEPNHQAALLAGEVIQDVFEGGLDAWMAAAGQVPYHAVVLSDVVEHVADPVSFLRALVQHHATQGATFVISIPNVAVWYNRMNTLLGRVRYSWSGLHDRTHLRFFTRDSFLELLGYCGLQVLDESCTPSLVQSAAPALRRLFEQDLAHGNHRALASSGAFKAYQRVVEPAEQRLCRVWPELLGFQLVFVARRMAP